MMNDLAKGVCDPHSVVCIVFDEAHKATSNYAYTTIIEKLSCSGVDYRVLALSATPGSDVKKIQSVRLQHIFLFDMLLMSKLSYLHRSWII